MAAYQIQVDGEIDGVTPFALPSPLPNPTDGGVIKLGVPISMGAIDLGTLSRQSGSPVWIRAIHIEFANGTRACRCSVTYQGTAEQQLVTPIISSSAGPLLMRPFVLNPGAVVPTGATLRILTDDVGPDFTGAPVLGPHVVYLDVVALDHEELTPLVQSMTAHAEAKEYADGEVFASCQAVAATLDQTMGIWRSPIDDLVGSNVASGQLVRAEVTVGTPPTAGETMRVEVFQDFGGGSDSLGYLVLDNTVAANSRHDIPIALPNDELLSGATIRVRRTYAAGMAPAPMADTCVRLRVAPTATGAVVGGALVESVLVTMPPMSSQLSEEAMRDTGRTGLLTGGHSWLLGPAHYVWYSSPDGSWDPGPVDGSLAGRLGIEVPLPPGNVPAPDVATFTAAFITAEGTYAALAVGDVVQINGTSVASAGTRPWLQTGQSGITGMQYSTPLTAGPFFATDTFRACRLDPAELPATPFIVTGGRTVVGLTHTAPLTCAWYQGGAGPGDYQGAARLGIVGTTSGAATSSVEFFASPAPFLVDPAAGDCWIAWMADVGGVTQPFPALATAAATTSNWITSGGQGIFVSAAGPASSNPADFPLVAPAIGGGTFASFPSIGIAYTDAANFQNNMVVVGRYGTREQDTTTFQSTSNDTLAVADSYNTPSILGQFVLDASVAYDAHVLNSNYRLSLFTGGATFDNFTGATSADIGEAGAGGTAIGWVDQVPATAIPIAPSSRIWIGLHFDASGSVLRFVDDTDPINTYGPPQNPAAYLSSVPPGECEVDDGTLGGVPTTNYVFDPSLPQVNPLPVPDGTIYNNDNYVGVRMRYHVPGFAVAP